MACSKDIRLEADGAVYYFRFLEWDTDFFGINSYVLDVDKSKLLPSPKIKELIAGSIKDSFVTLKIATSLDKDLLAFLQALGFNYIDTEITLEYNEKFARHGAEAAGVRVLEMKKNPGLACDELGGVFRHTRFHSDVHIPKEKADGLWINYIRTYRPSKTKRMYVAECDGETAGAILAGQSEDGRSANLFFVGVLKRFQGRRVGSALIRYVSDKLKDAELTVGTQGKNIPAINFYIKNGFSIVHATKIIFHRWA